MRICISNSLLGVSLFSVGFLLLNAGAIAQDMRQTSDVRPSDGVIMKWEVLGPLPVEDEYTFRTVSIVDATDLDSPDYDGEGFFWHQIELSEDSDKIDLFDVLGDEATGVAYAQADVYVNRDMSVLLRIKTRCETTCWVNGEEVAVLSTVHNPRAPRESVIPLRVGWNRIVIGTHSLKRSWTFSAQLRETNGKAIDPKLYRLHVDELLLSERQIERSSIKKISD